MTPADRARDFAQDMREDGFPCVVIYMGADDRVQMATPEIPAETMRKLLTAAMDTYAARERAKLN